MDEKTRKIHMWKRALREAKLDGDLMEMNTINNQLGILYFEAEDYTKALECHQEELSLSNRVGSAVDIAVACRRVGDVKVVMGQYEEAISFYIQQLEIAEQNDMRREEQRAHACLGDAYRRLGDQRNEGEELPLAREAWQSAASHFTSSIAIAEEFPIDDAERLEMIQNSKLNLGLLKSSEGSSEDALVFMKEALSIAERRDDHTMQNLACGNLAIELSGRGDFQGALEFATRALEISKSVRDRAQEAYAYYMLAEIHSKAFEFDKALESYRQYAEACDRTQKREARHLVRTAEKKRDIFRKTQELERDLESERDKIDRDVHFQIATRKKAADNYRYLKHGTNAAVHLEALLHLYAQSDSFDGKSWIQYSSTLKRLVSTLISCGKFARALGYAIEQVERNADKKLDGNAVEALVALGTVHENLEDIDEARRAFERARSFADELSDVRQSAKLTGRLVDLSRTARDTEATEKYEAELQKMGHADPDSESSAVEETPETSPSSPTESATISHDDGAGTSDKGATVSPKEPEATVGTPPSDGAGSGAGEDEQDAQSHTSHHSGQVNTQDTDDPIIRRPRAPVQRRSPSPGAVERTLRTRRPRKEGVVRRRSRPRAGQHQGRLVPKGDARTRSVQTQLETDPYPEFTGPLQPRDDSIITYTTAYQDRSELREERSPSYASRVQSSDSALRAPAALAKSPHRNGTHRREVDVYVSIAGEDVTVRCDLLHPRTTIEWIKGKAVNIYSSTTLMDPVVSSLRMASDSRELAEDHTLLREAQDHGGGEIRMLAVVDSMSPLSPQQKYRAVCGREGRTPSDTVYQILGAYDEERGVLDALGRGLDDEAALDLLETVQFESSLRVLILAANPRVSSGVLSALLEGDGQQAFIDLEVLDVSATALDADGFDRIARAICTADRLPKLRSLQVGFNSLGEDEARTARALAILLQGSRPELAIGMSRNFLSQDFLRAVLEEFRGLEGPRRPGRHYRSVNLAQNWDPRPTPLLGSDSAINCLFDLASSSHALRMVDVRGCGASEDGVRRIETSTGSCFLAR